MWPDRFNLLDGVAGGQGGLSGGAARGVEVNYQ